ncbi:MULTISPECIES: cytochrome c oxidase accessory protein CcoG [unclassified Moraxella]|uniref:cytochrome c oxidase accessory protein CcoG n=1 Tax=unclassified Moraxella TaxID=2685852 RepID=UPI003AF6B72F
MSVQPSSNNDFKLPVHQIDATKKRVHPRFVTGFYQNIRVFSMYFLLLLFLVLPWLKWDGHQAIWFDFPESRIILFGSTFLPQDVSIFAFFFIIAAFSLFMVTVYAGRVWCGYACPQTIWTHLYQYTEKIVIGDRNKQFKLDKQPWNAEKVTKRGIVYVLWLIFAFITAFTFVSYVVGTDYLISHFFAWSNLTWVFLFIFTFATFANAGYMREHFCTHICPYGRFQSVMFDKDTLIVSYDYKRGEPRGARKKGKEEPNLGDCINCLMCVQVCPTGIDIRDGLQVECIQCAACVDACNEIMDKVGLPRGLVRYSTERQLEEGQASKLLRPRLFAYSAVITILFGVAIYAFSSRMPLQIDIRRDRNQLSSVNAQGLIENTYIIKVTNKTQQPHEYAVSLTPQKGLTLDSRFKTIPLEAGESYDMPVSVLGDPKVVGQGKTPIQMQVISVDDGGQYKAYKDNVFTTEQ